MRVIRKLLILVIIFGMPSAAIGEVTLKYCKAADFTDVCADLSNPADPTACEPRKTARALECADLQESWWGIWDKIKTGVARIVSEQITLILGGIASFFAVAAAFFKKRLNAISKRVFNPLIQVTPKYETLAVNVLVVGKGGTGKTSIVRALSGSEDVNPAISTPENNLYSIAHEVDHISNNIGFTRVLRIYMSDHVGQDFGSISETAFFDEDKLDNLPKCIIFVADIFPPDENYGEDKLFNEPNLERVQQHCDTFHADMIRTITGKLRTGSKIVLFINKLDKLRVRNGATHSNILKAFDALIDELRQVRGAELIVVLGSATTGQGIMGCQVDHLENQYKNLYETIVETARPVRV